MFILHLITACVVDFRQVVHSCACQIYASHNMTLKKKLCIALYYITLPHILPDCIQTYDMYKISRCWSILSSSQSTNCIKWRGSIFTLPKGLAPSSIVKQAWYFQRKRSQWEPRFQRGKEVGGLARSSESCVQHLHLLWIALELALVRIWWGFCDVKRIYTGTQHLGTVQAVHQRTGSNIMFRHGAVRQGEGGAGHLIGAWTK